MRLENKVVAILGGGSELALTVGKLLLKEGSSLVLIDSSLDYFKNTLNLLEEWKDRITIYAADVDSQTEVDRALEYIVKEYKKIDIIVNCTGTLKNWRHCQ